MLYLIVNPVAGNGLASSVGKQADEYLTQKGVEHTMLYTEYAGHAIELSKQLSQQGAQTVISVGGDGTTLEIAQGLLNTKTALGIIPAGTGNDFIKSTKTPSKWKDALDFILTSQPRPVDAGMMNERVFLNECGTGYDVMVLDYALKAKKHVRGLLPYLYGVICATFKYNAIDMQIELDDGTCMNGKYLVCAIANGRFIGGGIPIAPLAEVADGLFDVVVVKDCPRWRILSYIPGLLSGKLLGYKVTTHYRCKTCKLSAKGMRLNIDGDVIPLETAEFRCMDGALLLYW